MNSAQDSLEKHNFATLHVKHSSQKRKKKKKGQNADASLYQLYPNEHLVCVWLQFKKSAYFTIQLIFAIIYGS